MRISDWSSDVCSSDLAAQLAGALIDALLQFLLALLQQLGRFDLRGDIGHGDDEAVVRHAAEVGGDEAAAAVGELDAQRMALLHVADPGIGFAATVPGYLGAIAPDLPGDILQESGRASYRERVGHAVETSVVA